MFNQQAQDQLEAAAQALFESMKKTDAISAKYKAQAAKLSKKYN